MGCRVWGVKLPTFGSCIKTNALCKVFFFSWLILFRLPHTWATMSLMTLKVQPIIDSWHSPGFVDYKPLLLLQLSNGLSGKTHSKTRFLDFEGLTHISRSLGILAHLVRMAMKPKWPMLTGHREASLSSNMAWCQQGGPLPVLSKVEIMWNLTPVKPACFFGHFLGGETSCHPIHNYLAWGPPCRGCLFLNFQIYTWRIILFSK